MRRVVGALVLLLLALLGAAAGYAAAPDEPDAPSIETFESPGPVPAQQPRLPVEIFRSDPDDPPLETAIELRTASLTTPSVDGKPPKLQLVVPVPDDWQETRPTSTRWQYTMPGNDALSYGLRIDLLADEGLSVESAKQKRESELKSARAQDEFTDLDITEDGSRGFTAVYVQDRYQRYSLERFYPGPDPNRVFASVAVYGRARDVTGLNDLLERISIGLKVVQTP